MSILPASSSAAAETGPDRVYFPQTGHYLAYGFLNYWRAHGNIQIFGYPISEEMKDPATGLTVQYFERAVFEWHADQSQVMLQRLGATAAQSINNSAFKSGTPQAPLTGGTAIPMMTIVTPTPGLPPAAGATVTAVATQATQEATNNNNGSYTVQDGDTLYGIAAKFNVSIDALMEANSITDPSQLQPNQVLVIP